MILTLSCPEEAAIIEFLESIPTQKLCWKVVPGHLRATNKLYLIACSLDPVEHVNINETTQINFAFLAPLSTFGPADLCKNQPYLSLLALRKLSKKDHRLTK